MEKKDEQKDLQKLQRSLREGGRKLHKLELRIEDLEAQILASRNSIEKSRSAGSRKNP